METYGVEGRWLTGGPPSGRRFMQGILPALACDPERPEGGLVVFDRAPHELRDLPGVRFRRLPLSPAPLFNGIEMQWALPRSATAVLYQSFTPPTSAAGRVVVIHDLIYLTRPEMFTRIERAYFRFLPMLLPRAEIVATVSNHVRQEILERYPKRDPATVHVVPNGVDPRFFLTPDRRAFEADRARQRYGLDRPYVVAVGRRNPRKNLARLVTAFGAAGLDDFDLVLAGPADGPHDAGLEAAIACVGPGRIRQLGEVPDGLLAGIYAGAECACYVSLAEGFGVPPLEAMATGTPVLASEIPPLREVAADAAMLVDPLDADAIRDGLRRVVLEAELRQVLVERGHARAAQFSWARSASAALGCLRAAADLGPRYRTVQVPSRARRPEGDLGQPGEIGAGLTGAPPRPRWASAAPSHGVRRREIAEDTAAVMVTHDGEAFLRKQCASIFGQDLLPAVLIVVDDASTDGSRRILEELRAEAPMPMELIWTDGSRVRDRKARIVRNVARGLAAAALYDMVLLSDQDDEWLPDRLSRQRGILLADPGALLVAGDAILMDQEGKELGARLRDAFPSPNDWGTLDAAGRMHAALRSSFVTGAAMALKTGLVHLMAPVPGGWYHDRWATLVAAARDGLVLQSEPVIKYRIHEGQVLGQRQARVGIGVRRWRQVRDRGASPIEAAARAADVVRRLRPIATDPAVRSELRWRAVLGSALDRS
jgi:glycosyltransferase involved in cell wall biosynthesis